MMRITATVVIIGLLAAFLGGCSGDTEHYIDETENDADVGTLNPSVRRIYLYFTDVPSSSQVAKLEEMGAVVFMDSWIPPAGGHPAGFLLADIPADMMEQVTALEFIVRVESAEEIIPLPDTISMPPPRHIPDREGEK